MMDGFIKVHRQSLDSRVFSDDFSWRLWCWCLMSANWKSSWNHGREIKPGQFVTGRSSASERLNCSPSKWYRGMQKLQEWGCIRMEVNSRWTTVTICNWTTYQLDEANERTAGEQPVNSTWTAGEQPVNTIEERKERKKAKNGKKEVLSAETEFVSIWNSLDSVIRNRGDTLTAKRRSQLNARLADPAWWNDFREAIAKFPLQCFAGDGEWKPDVDWILKPDTVSKILEGKYDWQKQNSRMAGRELRLDDGSRQVANRGEI